MFNKYYFVGFFIGFLYLNFYSFFLKESRETGLKNYVNLSDIKFFQKKKYFF